MRTVSSWMELGLLIAGLGASLGMAWHQPYQRTARELPAWRQGIFRVGLIGNALSLVLYLADLVRFQLTMRGLVGYNPSGWADTWALLALFGVGLGSAACGAFGRGLARPLTIANGVVMAALWYFLALGTSA